MTQQQQSREFDVSDLSPIPWLGKRKEFDAISGPREGLQGLKLTFLCWRQPATGPKFLVARWQFLVAKIFSIFPLAQNTCCASVFLAIFMLKNQLYSYQKTIMTRNQKKVESKSSSSNENSPTLKRKLLQIVHGPRPQN